MTEVIWAGVVTGYAIAVPVGAVAALIIALTAQTSFAVGAGAALGVATTDGLYATVAVTAGAAVSTVLAPIEDELSYVSTAVLLGIAALTLRSALRPGSGRAETRTTRWTPLRAWITFVGITAVNPATVVYFAAIVLSGTVQIEDVSAGVVFVAAAFLASASWQLVLAGVGAGLGTWFAGPRGRRTTGIVAAILIAALAITPLL